MSHHPDDALECLDASPGDPCEGEVQYRMALSATGRSFPRCAKHWEIRLDEHQQHTAAYPDSPVAPSWFDPSYAGERWDEDY